MRSNLFTLFVGLTLVACGDEPKKHPIGGTCDSDEECISGFCAEGQCLDPEADDDGDGIINRIEVMLGSNPLLADTDDDGFNDNEEIVNQDENVDTDGDGIPDIVESTVKDADLDCMPDQYDPENTVASDDLSPMIDVVCSKRGVCDGQRAAMRVTCPDGSNAICDYTNVAGYENPETHCDNVDQNCDGEADEAFDDRDADGLANCVDTDWDNDGVEDGVDNCPVLSNASQDDGDEDGIGDLCVSSYALVFLTSPSSAIVGIPFNASVGITQKEGDADAPLPPFRGVVSLTLDANGSNATLTGTANATAGADGVAHWSGLGITAPGTDLKLTATSGGLAPVDSDTFDGSSGALASFRIDGVPAQVTAGVGVPFTITPLDQNGNAILDFEGTVTLTSTDPDATADGDALGEGLDVNLAALPEAVAFYRTGEVTFTVTEAGGTATGSVTTTVADTGFAELEVVTSGDATVAGEAFTVTVTARDAFGNVASEFNGIVTLSVDDAAATLPATTIDFSTLDPEQKTFSGEVVLRTAGARTLTATDGTITGTADVNVSAAAASQFFVSSSAGQVASGGTFDLTVSARDPFGNIDPTFTGTVDITGTDLATTVPASYTFTAGDAGSHTFEGVTLGTAGTQSITVTSGALTGTTTVNVIAGNVAALVVRQAPTDVVAGVPFTVQIELLDAQGNRIDDGPFTVHVVYPDGTTADVPITSALATLPNLVYTHAGDGVVSFALSGQGIADNTTISFAPAAASRLALVAPATVVAGTPHDATLTAYDQYDNVASGYRGTVTFTTSDEDGDVPAPFTFTAQEAGAKQLSGFIGRNAASATLSANDGTRTANATVVYTPGPAASVTIGGLPPSATAGGTLTLDVTVRDAYGNIATGYSGTIVVTSTDGSATLPAPHTFTAGNGGQFTFGGIVLESSGTQTVTISDGTLNDDVVITINPATATHFDVVLADDSLPAGVTTSLVVTARDAFGNVASGYRGTVRFTSSDPNPQLPPNYAFTANDGGQKTFGNVAFRTVGSQTVSATDTVTASITGSDTIAVEQGNDIVFVLQNAPGTIAAGTAFGVTLRVEDAFGNLITNYGGRVAFSSTDTNATLPALYDFSGAEGGVKAFTGIVLKTSGARSVTITDQDDTAVSSTAIVDVTPLAMSSLELSCGTLTVVAGGTFACNVRARDQYNNIATGYRGTVTFSSNDPNATLPAPTSFGASDAGERNFTGMVFETSGQRTLTIADGAATDNATFTVSAATPTTLTIAPASGTSTAGVAFDLTVTARDAFGNVAPSYRGTVGFGVDAGNATLPGNYTFAAGDNGVHAFTGGFALQRAGMRTITVTGTQLANPNAQATRTIDAAAATKLTVASNLSTVVAGQQLIELTVTAKDQFDNTAPTYRGTVRFAVDAGGATFPANYTFVAGDNGVHAFQGTARSALELVGARVVTATDVATTSITGTSGTITVTPAPAASFVVSAPSSATSGIKFNTTIEARDQFGNTASGYRGTIVFSVDTGTGSFPTGYAFTAADAGIHAFDADPNRIALNLSGSRTLTVRDSVTATITGSSGTIVIAPGAASRFTVTGMPASMTAGGSATLTLTVYDAQDNVATNYTGTFNITSSDPNETFPATASVSTNGTTTFSGGFRTVPNPATNQQTITVANTVGTVQVGALVNPAAGHTISIASAPTDAVAGVQFTALVRVRDQFGNVATGYTGTVSFTSNDTQATLPANYTYVAATDKGEHTFTFTLKTVGSAQRINVNGTGGLTNNTAFVDVRVSPAGAASLVVTAGVSTASAGQLIPFSIEAKDAFGNRATGYLGTVQGRADSGGGTWQGQALPRTYTFTAGDAGFRSFNSGNEQFSFSLVGTRTIIMTDTVTASITGTSGNITVGAGTATTFTLTPSLPATTAAGTQITLTISTFDASNNAAPYTGSFTILSSDPNATGLTPVSFSNQNSKSFQVTLVTAGAQTITARNSALGGDKQVSTTVTPLAASKFSMTTATTTTIAGVAFTVTVAARDTYNNIVPSYVGTATFTAPDDTSATLPANYTFIAGDAGDHDFSVTLKQAKTGSRVTVNDASFTNGSATVSVDVTPAAASKIKVDITPAGNATAGTAFTTTGTIQDAFDNTVKTFTGPVKITSNDTQATSPTITYVAADQGVKSTSYTLFTAGSRTVTLTHDIAGGITGNTSKTVVAAGLGKLAFSTQPVAGLAGEKLTSFVVELQDAWSNHVNTTGTAVTVSLPVNPGRARVTGTLTQNTSAGLATFTDIVLSQPGVGYQLRAGTGAFTVTSSTFDVTWRPPTLTLTNVTQKDGCLDMNVTMSQTGSANVDFDMEYDVVGDSPDLGWQKATQGGSALGDAYGVTGLPTSTSSVTRALHWAADRDLGTFTSKNVNVRVTGYAGSASTTASFSGVSFNSGYTPSIGATNSGSVAPAAMAVGDFDRDGLMDMVTVRGVANNSFTIFRGATDKPQSALSFNIDASPQPTFVDVAVADMNADGFADIVLADGSTNDRAIIAFMGFPASGGTAPSLLSFTVITKICSSGLGPTSVAAGQIDTDRNPEAVFACDSNKAITAIDFTGQFWTTKIIAGSAATFPTQAPTSIALADLDRDFDKDIVVGSIGGTVQVYRNDSGGATWVRTTEASIGTTGKIWKMALADIDEDGDFDVVAGDETNKQFRLAIGKVEGTPATVFFQSSGAVATDNVVRSVAVADLDNDGVVDLVGGSRADDRVVVARSQNWGSGTPVRAAATTGSVAGSGPIGVAIADMGRDGKADVLYARGDASATTGTVGYVITNTANTCDSRFDGPGHIPLTQYEIPVTKTLDYNKDGKTDVLVFRGPSGQVIFDGLKVFLGSGDGRFASLPVEYGRGNAFVDVAWGDFNADGTVDFVTRDSGGKIGFAVQSAADPYALAPLTNNGTFATATDGPVVGDFDLDGDDDIAIAQAPASGGDIVNIYLRGATGTYTVAAATKLLVTGGIGLAQADLNGDGLADFVVSRDGATNDEICPILSSFGTTPIWSDTLDTSKCRVTSGRLFKGFTITDLEGNGTPELAFVTATGQTLRFNIYRQSSPGVFDSREDDGSAVTTPEGYFLCQNFSAFELAQMDGSGDLDLVMECNRGNTAETWTVGTFPRTAGRFNASPIAQALGPEFSSLAVGELTGDRKADIIYAGSTLAQDASLDRVDEPGTFLAMTSPVDATDATFGDFDGDGDVDIMAVDGTTTVVHYTQQTSTGVFAAPVVINTALSDYSRIDSGDLNKDGRRDFILTSNKTGSPRVVVETQTNPTTYTSTTLTPRITGLRVVDLVIADFDGDGLDDVGAGTQNSSSDTATFWLQNIDNTYTVGVTGFGDAYEVEVGNFDTVASGSPSRTALAAHTNCNDVDGTHCFTIYRCDKSNGFPNPNTIASLGPTTGAVESWAVADINRDGRDDIIYTDSNDTLAGYIAPNVASPTGVWAAWDSGQLVLGPSHGMQIADLDRNGWVDILVLHDDQAHSAVETFLRFSASTVPDPDHNLESFGRDARAFKVVDLLGLGRLQMLGVERSESRVRVKR